MKSARPLGRKDHIVVQELHDEVLVYDLQKNKALCLNRTAAAVWLECDGTKSVADISRDVSQKLKTNVSEDLVWLAVHQLKTENLLDKSAEFTAPFDGLNRREIIKRIGLASIVALPVISAIVAPTAVHAQSANTCGPIGNCTSGSTTLCVCLPIAPVGSNINPDGCPCATNGDCSGGCSCANPCTAGTCPPGETCQSGLCSDGLGGGSGTACNGSCPAGVSCVTTPGDSAFGTCAGTCLPGNNVCVGGTVAPICIPGDTSNLNPDCCPCSNVEGCANCCNDGVCGPCVG